MKGQRKCHRIFNDTERIYNIRIEGFTLIELLVIIVVVTVLVCFILPMVHHHPSRPPAVACMNNLRQLSLASLMYADDHGDYLPPVEKWCDYLETYATGNIGTDRSLFRCVLSKSESGSFSINGKLSGLKMEDVTGQQNRVLFFESTDGWNLHGDEKLIQCRHQKGSAFCVVFVDSHAERIPYPTDTDSPLEW